MNTYKGFSYAIPVDSFFPQLYTWENSDSREMRDSLVKGIKNFIFEEYKMMMTYLKLLKKYWQGWYSSP